jgi:hypothetical protein
VSEQAVLAACLKDRGAFSKVEKHLSSGDELAEQSKIIFEQIREYYKQDLEATRCDPEIVTRYVQRTLNSPKHKEMFASVIKNLAAMEVSPANVIKDILAVKRESAGNALATALAAQQSADKVMPLLHKYEEIARLEEIEDADKDRSVMRGESIGDLVRTTYQEGRIKVWPKALNDALGGGVLPGHHMVVYARPEIGKTLTIINMIAGFLYQDLVTLYVGNEDPIIDIAMRVVSRLSGKTIPEVLEDPDPADALARTRGYENLVMASLAPGTPSEIEALIEEYNPKVVVVDQLRNLNGGEQQFVQKLEKVAIAMRTLGKRHQCFMVSVTQAGDSASNKAVLDMGDVDSSNTGIPATADVMLGIGATAGDIAVNRRVFSLPKNKVSGEHTTFPVSILPQLSKIKNN